MFFIVLFVLLAHIDVRTLALDVRRNGSDFKFIHDLYVFILYINSTYLYIPINIVYLEIIHALLCINIIQNAGLNLSMFSVII